ncbi:SHOCT domain-containing protein [Weissella kandleri]|uniref:SHOCT domain-containing protein n=1 Tax=Weissella kandleri TaxID=1616 RepID=UPI00387E4FF7
MKLFKTKEEKQRIKEEEAKIQQEEEKRQQELELKFDLLVKNITDTPLDDLAQSTDEVILKNTERLFFKVDFLVNWQENRTRTERVGYSGLSSNIKITKNISYRVGNIKPMVNTITEQKIIRQGKIYITNKRLIMASSQNPGEISLSSIVNIIPYTDGIEFQRSRGKNIIMTGFNGLPVMIIIQRLISEGWKVPKNNKNTKSLDSSLIADEIRKLAELKEQGFLTQEEFDDQKQKLLNK